MAFDNVASCTITGAAGPGNTVSAQTFNNVTSFTFDVVNQLFIFEQNGFTRQISIALSPTITITTSSGNYTVTVA